VTDSVDNAGVADLAISRRQRSARSVGSAGRRRSRAASDFGRLRQALAALAHIAPGADGYGTLAPTAEVRDLAARVLDAAEQRGDPPAEVVATADETVVVRWLVGARRAEIECYPAGEVVALCCVHPAAEPVIWEAPATDAGLRETVGMLLTFLAPGDTAGAAA